MPHICAVVPVYNEQENIAELVARLVAALGKVSEDFRIVIVDDGSSDGTWPALMAQSSTEPRLQGLRLSRNFGQHAAITAGLSAAEGEWIVVMDGDLQDRPEVIPDLYARASEGFDIVFVQRQDRPESRLYLAGQKIFYSVLRNMTRGSYDGSQGNFSIISRQVLDNYNALNEGDRFYGGLIEWLGFSRGTLPAKHGTRHAGDTKYTFVKRLRFARNIILAFSTRPLDLTLNLGLFVTAGALLMGFIIFLRALFFSYSTDGWASIMVSIYFLGGVQMIMIGMVGQYVGRISDQIKGRPPYIVAEMIRPRGGT